MNATSRDKISVDTTRLPLLLGELRLPTIGALWPTFTDRADREGWPAARLLATLAELELADRAQRRIARHLVEACESARARDPGVTGPFNILSR